MKKGLLIVIGIVIIAATSMFAIAAETNNNGKAVALINKITRNNVTIVKRFASINNLVGFVVRPKSPNASSMVIYADKTGKYLLMGTLVDGAGNNVTHLACR